MDSVVLPAHGSTSGCPSGIIPLEESVTFSPSPVQEGQLLRITMMVTNAGNVPVDFPESADSSGGFLPFSQPPPYTVNTDDFPTTLNPGESGVYDVEGVASECFGDQNNQSLFLRGMDFESTNCTGNFEVRQTEECIPET